MLRHSTYKVESIDLTDGLPKHRITARDVIDRTPFSVYGTFDGRVGLVKSSSTIESDSDVCNCIIIAYRILFSMTSQEIWRTEDPVITRIACENFSTEEIIPIEQIWEGSMPPALIDTRMNTYKKIKESYSLLAYGEMYDKCKENPGATMPLCWTAPLPEGLEAPPDNSLKHLTTTMHELISDRQRHASDILESLRQSRVPQDADSQSTDFPLAPRYQLRTSFWPLTMNRTYSLWNKSETKTKLTERLSKSQSILLQKLLGNSCERTPSSSKTLRRSSSTSFSDELVQFKCVDNDQTPISQTPSSVADDHRFRSQVGLNAIAANDLEGEMRNSDVKINFEGTYRKYTDELSFVFGRLGMDPHQGKTLKDARKIAEVAVKDDLDDGSETSTSTLPYSKDSHELKVNNKVDDGHQIKLQYRISSFDFGPVGYSGLLCLVKQHNNRQRLVFVPFIAPDEGFATRPEFTKVIKETRVWESFDSVPYHLYQLMKLRLFNGMDRIDDENPLISLFHRLAEQIPTRWMQWLLSASRKQQTYNGISNANELDSVSDTDELSGNERSSIAGCDEDSKNTSIDVKGLPGLLQLCSLELESDVTWHDCDSFHFTFVKIARSHIRRMLLAPFCLPVSEDRIVSDEKFAASTDILQQMPVIFLCLINGDSIRFIEYTLYLRRKLGKPVFTDDSCSFLNAFHFFTTVVSRYVNRISDAENKSSPKYVARRLRLVDKIHAFVKEHAGSSTINPFIIPMLLIILGELTSTHPGDFTKIILKNKKLPLSLRLAWCVNLLPTNKMKEAIYCLYQQKTVESLTLPVDDANVKEVSSGVIPSLYSMFPTSYLNAADDMEKLLHLARAEFCRYSYILQRMKKYCFRRRLLNLVPQIYWPDFKTSVDISCTFCGSSNEIAVRNAESAMTDLTQVRSRSTVSRTTASRSSASISGNSIGPGISLSLSSTAPSDSDTSTCTAVTESLSYDYNGVDGGTEAEMCSHGGHTKHVISWFEKEDICPVLGCDCRCLHLENGVEGRVRQTIMTPF
ncbi:unnamed protein product [Strongylus vulgaris]|uniref:GATOR2 complex protein MIO zinc-ribbon like domain-containing protein n=1 Tax=Strongylus vulgaris TaxID=40348 RepID=A0A3P7JGX1_STRVU|nr:unnamed protein product [Strongylus vulgaris]